jgi:hypothetical protein
MVFKRIPEVLKSGAETNASRFVAPDPANELKHPENQSLFARFKEDSRAAAPGKNPPWAIGYGARAHSDLISRWRASWRFRRLARIDGALG